MGELGDPVPFDISEISALVSLDCYQVNLNFRAITVI